jgi:large subunit ribosomal protein L2
MKKYLNYIVLKINKRISIGSRPLSGRNYLGNICCHHKSGGNKKRFYYIDFYRRQNCYGYLLKILKNPNYTSFLGFFIYENGLFSYILLSETLKIGDICYSGTFYFNKDTNKIGLSLPLKNIRLFTLVNNLEIYPYSGGTVIRSAGTSCLLIKKEKNKVILKLKSK